MSCDIREYKGLILTAFVGPSTDRFCIQFTMGAEYVALGAAALQDMMATIEARLLLKDGYTATGEEREDVEYKDRLILDGEVKT
jgi:hypothetical protein